MAVIEKNRHGLLKPRAGQNQIKGMVAVDVACHDLQATRRGDDQNPLALASRNLQPNPVVCLESITSPGFDIRKVGTAIAVQVGNCKPQSRSAGTETTRLMLRTS